MDDVIAIFLGPVLTLAALALLFVGLMALSNWAGRKSDEDES